MELWRALNVARASNYVLLTPVNCLEDRVNSSDLELRFPQAWAQTGSTLPRAVSRFVARTSPIQHPASRWEPRVPDIGDACIGRHSQEIATVIA